MFLCCPWRLQFFLGGAVFGTTPPAPQTPQRKSTKSHWNKAIPKQKHHLPSSNIHTFLLFRTLLLRFSVCFLPLHDIELLQLQVTTYIPFFKHQKNFSTKNKPPSPSLPMRSQAGEVRKDITDEECQGGCVQAETGRFRSWWCFCGRLKAGKKNKEEERWQFQCGFLL